MTILRPDSSGELAAPFEPADFPVVVVGSNPWDEDPATYTHQTAVFRSGFWREGFTFGDFDDDPPPLTTTTLSLRMVYSAETVGPDADGIETFVNLDLSNQGSFSVVVDFGGDILVADGVTREVTRSMNLDDPPGTFTTDLPTVLAAMQNPYSVAASRAQGSGGTANETKYHLTIYELYFEATEGASEPITEIRVTRQFPRDDSYGAGSAPRIHPPPRRGRIVGGQE